VKYIEHNSTAKSLNIFIFTDSLEQESEGFQQMKFFSSPITKNTQKNTCKELLTADSFFNPR
jgi:hypothetical protein